jgi:unsaturated rhamnogalacturonyl hydrolase
MNPTRPAKSESKAIHTATARFDGQLRELRGCGPENWQRAVRDTLLRIALLLVLLGVCRAAEPVEAAGLRRVADHVLAQTSRRLIDRGTGETFADSTALAPKPEISIESKFNAWFYQTWLLADGMRRAAAALDEPRYRDYGEQNIEFIYRHMDYFQRQHAAKMKAAPVGDGVLSPIGFYFNIGSLWQTGLAPLVLERHTATKDARYEPFLARVRKFIAGSARFDDGLLYRKGKGAMTDDPYMTVPFLVREGRFDEAAAQVLGTHARVFDRETGLMSHLWDVKTERPSGMFWGRGNGWMVLAQVELLSALPASHPRRAEVLAAFRAHMAGLRRHQHAEGGWHQVLDHPESWVETSATGMITYGLARGVNEGWLDATFADSARNGWLALQTKLTPDGDLLDVCGSTDTGDLAYYLKRPRLRGDLHGFGSFLLAGAEVVVLGKTNGKR